MAVWLNLELLVLYMKYSFLNQERHIIFSFILLCFFILFYFILFYNVRYLELLIKLNSSR